MGRRIQRTDDEARINVTPLLDIVFILLIFFIVTATFLREKGIDITTLEDCADDDCGGLPPPTLLLAVQEDGFVRVNNVRIIDALSVKPVVQEFVAREPNGLVLVSVAPDSESGVAVQVMDRAADGGARVKISLQQES